MMGKVAATRGRNRGRLALIATLLLTACGWAADPTPAAPAAAPAAPAAPTTPPAPAAVPPPAPTPPAPAAVAPSTAEPVPTDPRQALADTQFRLANGMYRRAMYRLAAKEFQSLITDYPDFTQLPAALFFLGECQRLQGDSAAAMQTYADLRQRFPADPFTRHGMLNTVRLLIDAKKYADALGWVERLNNTSGDDPAFAEAVRYYHGVALSQDAKGDAAIGLLAPLANAPITNDFPYRLYARWSLAYLYRNRQNAEGAAKLLNELAASTTAPADLRDDAMYQLGELAYTRADYPAAVAAYTRLLTTFPASPRAAAARVNKGWALLLQQQYQAVLDLFKDQPGVAPLPVNDEAVYLQGMSLLRLQQPEAALAKDQQLLHDFPQSSYAEYAQAAVIECLFALKRYAPAAAAAKELLAAAPAHKFAHDLYYLLVRAQREQEDWAGLAAACEDALAKCGPGWERREEVLLQLADAYRHQADPAHAAGVYQRLLVLVEPVRQPGLLLLIGESLVDAGNDNEAAVQFAKVTTDYPQSPEVVLAQFKLAELKTRTQDFPAAIGWLDRLLAASPKHALAPQALYLRGTLHYRQDRRPAAIADLRAALAGPFPEQDAAALVLAYALWEDGQEKEALDQFTALLDRPTFATQVNTSVLVTVATRMLERDRLPAATKAFALLAAGATHAGRVAGLVGQAQLATAQGKPDDATALYEQARQAAGADGALQAVALAYLGEHQRQLQHADQAVTAFEQAIKLGTKDARAGALARYGMAEVLLAKGLPDKAASYATGAYVLYDDARYSPLAMLLLARVSLAAKHPDEAQVVYRELAQKYPARLAELQQLPAYKDLFTQLGPLPAASAPEKK